METPSSVRRVTRSQTLAAATSGDNNNISILKKVEDCDNNGVSKSRPRNRKSQDLPAAKAQDRSALIDITNDSPIVGLAAGNLMTPISSVAKQRSSRPKMMTPGSGEALLRGQVKTLLQKVEEEAEISKLSLESRPFVHLQSPAGLLAPTPANTPQISNMSQDENLSSMTNIPIVEEQLISQVVGDLFDGKKQEESQITRSLLLDFSEKTETSDDAASSSDCSSVLTHQEKSSSSMSSPSLDDDNSSLWSIQVNASSHGDEEEEDPIEEEKEEDGEEEDDDDGGLVEELCRGLSRISVNEKGKAVEFAGKHTRFMYDSEDELIEEVRDESVGNGGVSPSILRLKGLPTPKGKHLRFPSEGEEEEVVKIHNGEVVQHSGFDE